MLERVTDVSYSSPGGVKWPLFGCFRYLYFGAAYGLYRFSRGIAIVPALFVDRKPASSLSLKNRKRNARAVPRNGKRRLSEHPRRGRGPRNNRKDNDLQGTTRPAGTLSVHREPESKNRKPAALARCVSMCNVGVASSLERGTTSPRRCRNPPTFLLGVSHSYVGLPERLQSMVWRALRENARNQKAITSAPSRTSSTAHPRRPNVGRNAKSR